MDLTYGEQRIVENLMDGALVDLATEWTDGDIDEGVMRSWGKEQQIRAAVVHDILRGRHSPKGEPDPRALRVRGAWIVGRIDLDGIRTKMDLELSSCYLPEGLDGRECVISRLTLNRSVIGTSEATGEDGAVRLVGAHIAGQLSMSDAALINEHGPALYADRLTVGGGVRLDGAFSAIGHGELGTVRLPGAHITGQLGMPNARLVNESGPALCADRMTVDGGVFFGDSFSALGHGERGAVRLPGAHIAGQLVMTDATLINETGRALDADGATVNGDAFLNGKFSATGHGRAGVLRLSGAHIAGRLVMTDATLINEDGRALDADGITVDGAVLLNRAFSARGCDENGTVRLLRAAITGPLVMSDASICNESGPAVYADGMVADDSVFLDGRFSATGHGKAGAVRMTEASIAGHLRMTNATLINETGPALSADGVTVGRASLNGTFSAIGHGEAGAVRLIGARVAGQLNMSDATLVNRAGVALVADRATVGSTAFFDGTFSAIGRHSKEGAVRVPGVHITGRLRVDAAIVDVARTNRWIVDGLTYDGYPSVGIDGWLALLKSGTPAYRPQPYQQLAAAARGAGHDGDARKVLMAQRDDQVRRGDLTPAAKGWARFTKLTLGYGYQPWRALVGVAFVLLAAVVMLFTFPEALTQPSRASHCTPVETFQIAIDMAIPLVSTSTDSSCHIAATPEGQFAAWVSVPLALSGWALTALFAAGFTRAIRQP